MAKQILLVIFFTLSLFDTNAQDYNNLEAKLKEVQKQFSIPGVSIAVVKGDKIIYQFNNGVTSLNSQKAITNETLFPIASATKTFTSMGIGILVDQKKISFDDRIVDYLPWFKLKNTYVTENLTIRDVLSHQSGLSSEGLIYLGSDFNREETVRRLAKMPISNGFRSSFSYSNLLYNALGLIIEKVSGLNWEDFIQIHILNAIGMKNSITDFEKSTNLQTAKAHRFIDYKHGKIEPAEFVFPKSNGPAGGIRSTSLDLAEYLKLLLNEGIKDNGTLIKPKTIKELWTPHNRSWGLWNRESTYSTYGLGWFLGEYDNSRVMYHPGGGGGVTSLISLIPSKDLGIAVLTNLDSWSAAAFANTIYDYFLNIETKDWSKVILPSEKSSSDLSKWYTEFSSSKIKNTKPSLSLKKYCGTYIHKIYGNVVVELDGSSLILKRGSLISDLSHWHYDTFKSIMRNNVMGLDTVTFYINASGEADEIMIWDVKGFIKEKNKGHANETHH